ncbi:MAG: phosphoribosylaminoimidazolesuccinocarboxamide synthase, partial [Candidatus Omnitrophica bacterium]|nr:phosphoribosylaminoimidazolesuccinocarboxamide synthase [Candidatus Omnitrophota bacterium]
MTLRKPLLSLDLVDIPLFRKGKVRNVYDLGETILFVATDRISAFDVVMQNGIPEKGRVLNMISAFWFGQTRDIVENHMVTVNIDDMVREYPVL